MVALMAGEYFAAVDFTTVLKNFVDRTTDAGYGAL